MDIKVLCEKGPELREARLALLFLRYLQIWSGEERGNTDGGWVPLTR